MGKRSNFPKIEKDAYMTFDPRATRPLLDYIGHPVTYYEPCVGKGDLIKNLYPHLCLGYSDEERDARTYHYETSADYFITNPPWTRDILHPIIENLRNQLPTWLLFDADWLHTVQAQPYLAHCKTIVSVGRLLWIPGTTETGKDNCAWYLFVKNKTKTEFIARKKYPRAKVNKTLT